MSVELDFSDPGILFCSSFVAIAFIITMYCYKSEAKLQDTIKASTDPIATACAIKLVSGSTNIPELCRIREEKK